MIERWARIKDDAYVLSSSPGGGISRTSDNVVYSSSPGWQNRGRSLPSPTASCYCFVNQCCTGKMLVVRVKCSDTGFRELYVRVAVYVRRFRLFVAIR